MPTSALRRWAPLLALVVWTAPCPANGRAQQPVEVTGRVFDDAGQPQRGVTLVLSDDEAATTRSDADGAFRLVGQRLYDTSLVVRSPGWARMTVSIPEGDDVGDLTLARAGHLTGWVRDPEGNPIVGARVLAVDDTGHGSTWIESYGDPNSPAFRTSTSSDARGGFVMIDAVRGMAAVIISAEGFETTRSVPVAAATPIEVTLQRARPSAPARPAAPRSTCVVRAVDADTRAELSAFSAGEYWDGDTGAGQAHRCSLSQVTASDGVVTLRFQRARGVEVRAMGYARKRVPMVRGDLQVELAPEGRIRGVVVDPATGAPLPDVRVRAALGDLGEPRRVVPTEPPIEAHTDAQGAFTVAGLGEGEWSLVATHPDRRRGPIATVRVDAGRTTDGVRLESPEGGCLEVTLTGRIADPRCRLRLARITPGRFDSLDERRIDGARPITGEALSFRGLDAGKYALELLVPQAPRFGRWRKLRLGTADVAGDRPARIAVDVAAALHKVRGTLSIRGAHPPMERLLVVAERDIETRMTHQSLFLSGPMARPANDGSFVLLAEPGEYSVFVVDAATRVILARLGDVEVDNAVRELDLGEQSFRARSLEVVLEGKADDIAEVETLEIRTEELWPEGLGRNQGMPDDEIDTKIGVRLIDGEPVRPVWIPACDVEVVARPSGTRVKIAAGDEAGATARLRLR